MPIKITTIPQIYRNVKRYDDATADYDRALQIAEEMLKYLLTDVMTNCVDDMQLFDKFIEKGLLKKLQGVVEKDFAHISYTEAVEVLAGAKKKFDFPVKWGLDLQSEHERYLTEHVFKRPVTVLDFPFDIKAFYRRRNEDGQTVAAMDVLVPTIGEIIGGSQREERYDVLEGRMEETGLPKDEYWWYLEAREFGSVPHSGFGLGVERTVAWICGIDHVRETSPYPRRSDLT